MQSSDSSGNSNDNGRNSETQFQNVEEHSNARTAAKTG